MTSRAIGMPSALLCLSVLIGTTPGGSDRPLPTGVTVRRDPDRGTIRWLESPTLSADLERDPKFTALQSARRWGDVAIAFLRAHRGAFRLDDPRAELRVASVQTDDLGLTHVRLQQQYRGLTVQGAELLLHLDRDAHVTLVNGRYVATPRGLATTPTLDAAAARRAARDDPSSPERPTELLIHLSDTGAPRLAYRVLVIVRPDEGSEVFVDAATGAILGRHPTAYPHAPASGARTP